MIHQPRDPDWDTRARRSFARQGASAHLGITLDHLAPGEAGFGLPWRPDVGQQHGAFHGGLIATLLDTACGYAALTLMHPGAEVMSVEFKVNFMAPARGERLLARGRVLRAGRTLTTCQGDASVLRDGAEVPVAVMLATMIALRERPEGGN